MKKTVIKTITAMTVGLLVMASSETVQATPTIAGGAACTNCHGTSVGGTVGGTLNVLPSDIVEIPLGGSQTVTFDITDIPSGKAAIALTGLADPLLAATLGAGWSDIAGAYFATDTPFVEAPAPQSYTLGLTIGAGATLGDYGIGGQFAGNKGFNPASWASTFDFTVRVIEAIPEPASLALMGLGLTTIGLMSIRRKSRQNE